MDSRKKIITKSFTTKQELAIFVFALLQKFAGNNTLQLTTIIQPGRYEVSYVTTAITASSPPSKKMPPTLVA